MNVKPKDVRQIYNWDCGLACVESVAGIRPKIGRPVTGTTVKELANWFRRRGETVAVGERWCLDDLKHHTELGRYVICLVNHEGYGHWVTVWKANRKVHFHDPMKGPRVSPGSEFVGIWSHDGYDGLSVAVTNTRVGSKIDPSS